MYKIQHSVCKAIIQIAAILASVILPSAANAAYVNINGVTGTIDNAVSIVLRETDTLYITPIGIADGGDYDSFSFFSSTAGCDAGGENCAQGFLWFLGYLINGDRSLDRALLSPVTLNADYTAFNMRENALSGLSAVVSDTPEFSITGVNSVSLYIDDDYHLDNRGGISFDYRIVPAGAVPVPATLALFGLGLLGLGWSGRRRG